MDSGVKNRSQADIKAGKSVQSCLEDERQYFKTHPVYGHMGAQYWGIPSLVEKLTRVLFLHIKHVLPEIRKEIQVKARGVQTRIQELGEVRLAVPCVDFFCSVFTICENFVLLPFSVSRVGSKELALVFPPLVLC